jgi:hypothetical protein
MSAIQGVFLIVIVAAILVAGCTQPSAVPEPSAAVLAVNMTVPFAPVPVTSTNGVNIAYEIELRFANQSFVPEKIEVIDPTTRSVVYSADAMTLAAVYHPADNPPPTPEELQNGTGKLIVPRISIWFRVSPDAVPDRLVQRLTLNRSSAGLGPVTVTGGEVAVRKDEKPVVLGSPLRGTGWVALETTSPTTHHFLGEITMNGVTRAPERYAVDWIYLDPVTGKAATGNASVPQNYFGYGKEIYAVANGTVADTLDGLPDAPGIFAPRSVTVATLAGNYVILDIGNNKYACYAHMVNGSVRVKKGDVVMEGQVLGNLGHSGNSDLPHLHFQVSTGAPSFLAAEGYPHVYRSFDVIGGINQTLADERTSVPGFDVPGFWANLGDVVTFLKQPVNQSDRLMEYGAVVRFP